jgi:hypothetical protein
MEEDRTRVCRKKIIKFEWKTNICGNEENTKANQKNICGRKTKITRDRRRIREERNDKEPSKPLVVLIRAFDFTWKTQFESDQEHNFKTVSKQGNES